MPHREFVDPDPLLRETLEERLRELGEEFPEPRSRNGERKFRRAKRRLMREFHVARNTTSWFAEGNTDEPS